MKRCQAYLGAKRKNGRCGDTGEFRSKYGVVLCDHHLEGRRRFGFWVTTKGRI